MSQTPTNRPSDPAKPGEATSPAPRARPAVSLRSVAVGLLGVLLICGITPFNDFVMNNSSLIGYYLPVGLVLFMLVFLMLVNAPLWKWAPHRAFTSGELAVVLGMALVSCTLPSSGLMRYLQPQLVGFLRHAGPGGDAQRLMQELDLPDWIFPTMQARTLEEKANDPVINDFWFRVPIEADGFLNRLAAVPWSAWITPAITWGLLLAALYGAVICLMIIIRRQWVENERLAFPLAQIYLSLIETPPPRRGLNALLSARSFWVAFILVFAVHGINSLHLYGPRLWPQIPLGYDLAALFSEGALRHTEGRFKVSDVYFAIIGITFFLQTKIAFSLWAFYVIINVVRMVSGELQADVIGPAHAQDQLYGAAIAFAFMILWIGRHHWVMVLRQMFRRPSPGEPREHYLPYWLAGWGLLACSAGVVAWLCLAGATIPGAILLVVLMLLMFLVVARVVAETGLIFVQVPAPLARTWLYLLNDIPDALSTRTTLQNFFFFQWFNTLFTRNLRESLAAYSLHAIRVADTAAYEQPRNARSAVWFILALAVALAVGFVTAGASTLYIHYSYATTLDVTQQHPVNLHGVDVASRWLVMDQAIEYMPPRTGPHDGHSRLGHFGFAAVLVWALGAMRLNFVGWPLHPVGFLVVHSYPLRMAWFSIFIGWLIKAVVVRFGGAELYRMARPFFIGLIIGEAGAAAFWLCVSFLRLWAGLDYHAVQLLP